MRIARTLMRGTWKAGRAATRAALSVSRDAAQTDTAEAGRRWLGVAVLILVATMAAAAGWLIALPTALAAGLAVALRWPRSRGLTWPRHGLRGELARRMRLTLILGGAGAAALALRTTIPDASPLLGLAGLGLILALAVTVAGSWTSRTLRQAALRGTYGARLAAVLGVQPSALESSVLDNRGGRLTVTPTPPGAALRLADLEGRLALAWPEYEADPTTSHERLVLVPVSADAMARRELLAGSEGMIESIEHHPTPAEAVLEVPAGFAGTTAELAKAHRAATRVLGDGWQIQEVRGTELRLVQGTPDPRPSAETWTLPAGTSPTAAARYAALARAQGLSLVEWAPEERRAVVANPLPAAVALRGRFAELLRTDRPWEIELALAFAVDEETGAGRIDTVTLLRVPAVGTAAEKRQATWAELVAAIPGGGPGWHSEEEPVTGAVTMRYGVPRSLPGLAPLADMLPAEVEPGLWSNLPLGIDPQGDERGINLKLGPMSLIVGPTGTGKTIALLALMMQALTRGHDVYLTDAVKGGADFEVIRPWASGWAETLPEASEMIQAIYAEVTRRKGILKKAGLGFWADLDEATRKRENIRPVMYVIDEFVSLVLPIKVDAALKGTEVGVELEEQNAAKALLAAYAGKIAREARFVGVHLALACQRPDAAYISGEMRSNLTSIIQLAKPGTMLARETLGMAFPGDQVQLAAERLAELDDGQSRGLAVMGADGGDVEGMRIAWAEPATLPGLLAERGVAERAPQADELEELVLDLDEIDFELEGVDEVA
ncbi:FtsK/SpoIIIE domain-containing protein [Sinomonas halotolerans]|uniref:FtsK/SpoIIIE domain-containing protein n=1 Tax=Sinomonas halotolerans TaxID=1644133 RepID=A0ABU9WWX6_9MICC